MKGQRFIRGQPAAGEIIRFAAPLLIGAVAPRMLYFDLRMTGPTSPGGVQTAAIRNEVFKYRADVDGLRAIAVLAVLFFHLHLHMRGGYVGVDVFFVISGYLIGGLILKDLDRGRFRLLDFWVRRVRRIFPALLFVTLFCLLAGWLLLMPVDFEALGESIVAQVFLASNIYFFSKTDYFGTPAGFTPLLHTWSLRWRSNSISSFPSFWLPAGGFRGVPLRLSSSLWALPL